MDDQKKQKVLIAVVAVLALGAGGYWFVGRDSGGSEQATVQISQSGRKERAEREQTERKGRRREREERQATAEPVERRKRVEREDRTIQRKRRKRSDRKSVKKEELLPAA